MPARKAVPRDPPREAAATGSITIAAMPAPPTSTATPVQPNPNAAGVVPVAPV